MMKSEARSQKPEENEAGRLPTPDSRLPHLSIGLRVSAWLVRLCWRLPSTVDAVKFSMATAHCGSYRVNEAVNQVRQRGERVTWEALAAYLPAATVFFVRRRFARLCEREF